MKICVLVPDNRDEFRRYADPEPYCGPAPTALLQGLADRPDCEVHFVCCSQRPMRFPEKIADNTFYHCAVVPKWGWLRGGYVGCMTAIRKQLRAINPDIVHGQGTERYCGLSAAFSGFPNVLTIHGNIRNIAKLNRAHPFSFLWLGARLESVTLPRVGGVFCNSAYTEALVKPVARKTWRVPNAICKPFFAPSEETPPGPVPILLNIGVIEPRKSQNEILEMAARLHRRKVKFQIQFIGKLEEGNPYGARFVELIRQARADGYADYLGLKSQPDVIALMDAAGGLIHAPSEEAFGLVVAEALARNLKFFGARVGGVADIAPGIEGAELMEPGAWTQLEEMIFQWLANGHPKPLRAAGEIRERYHPSVIASRHVEIYREVLSGWPS